MRLTFGLPTLKQVLETTLWTQEEGITPYWRNQLYEAYPQINRDQALRLSETDRMRYITDILTQIYQKQSALFSKKASHWQAYWDALCPKITQAFSVAYQIEDMDSLLNDMVCYVNLNPVCPRYLDQHTFYVFYQLSDELMLITCLHEVMHFLWFYRWQQFFHDDPVEYETPHLKWLFSEMVQDTMMRCTPIRSFFGTHGNTYPYFYTMEIDGQPILETLAQIYQTKGLVGLFQEGYIYCVAHEQEIRAAVHKAEQDD